MLTLAELKAIPPNTIFARGVVENSPEGIFMTRDGGLLRWVAVRGGIHDWCIYCLFASSTWSAVKTRGDKITQEAHIKKLVPCTDEAFQMYRY
jgi:hypothetical protein